MKPLGEHKVNRTLDGHQHCSICHPKKKGGRSLEKRLENKQRMEEDIDSDINVGDRVKQTDWWENRFPMGEGTVVKIKKGFNNENYGTIEVCFDEAPDPYGKGYHEHYVYWGWGNTLIKV
jgi:hypothetical protein